MATVLQSRIQVNDETRRSENSSFLPKLETQLDYDVVFVTDTSTVSEKAFEFALEAARKFSARLVLLYATGNEEVPAAFLDYAQSEGIQDYEWRYYSMVANERLAAFVKLAEASGVKAVTSVHIGDLKGASKAFAGRNAIVVLNHSNEKKRIFGLRSSQNLAVPVLVY